MLVTVDAVDSVVEKIGDEANFLVATRNGNLSTRLSHNTDIPGCAPDCFDNEDTINCLCPKPLLYRQAWKK